MWTHRRRSLPVIVKWPAGLSSHIPKMPLFGKPKSPKELIQSIHENLLILNSQAKQEKERRKAIEAIATALNGLRELLTDKSDTRLTGRERDAELFNSERTRINEIITEVTHELINLNVLPLLIANLDTIEFESSKHVVDLFGHVMRRQVGSYNPAAQYLLSNPHILVSLLHGYSKPDRAIHYGALLGELLLERHNFSVMTRYIADPENLKVIMNLLTSEKKQIAFEAFHCFKVDAISLFVLSLSWSSFAPPGAAGEYGVLRSPLLVIFALL
ncbi:hypothetical protein PHET_09200 [Paragonimus heterotremus]|uniref:Uncharacterized protein n=1 Tax=Paragonimus heterotremus TaxID=100268 RepID=A0A8J4T378_9TREM|nr:hypothetical protein PHET_09200 [Paragonimus heterotremus]